MDVEPLKSLCIRGEKAGVYCGEIRFKNRFRMRVSWGVNKE